MVSFATRLSGLNTQILCTVWDNKLVYDLLAVRCHRESFLLLFCLFVCFCLGDRLSDFYVGVTDISPHDVPPHPHPPSYKLCQYHRGPVNQRETETIACAFPVSGRYVVIQLLTVGTPLSLCEVEVYTGKRPHVDGKGFFTPSFLVAFFEHCV